MSMDFSTGCVKLKEDDEQRDLLDILFVGDLCTRQRTQGRILRGESAHIFSEIMHVLKDKDISVVNMENPLSLRGKPTLKTGPNIIGDPGNVEILKYGLFDVATLANNHIGDYGDEAVMDTLDALNRNSILTVGAGKNLKEAVKLLSIQKKGRKIAILNYVENESGIAELGKAGAAPLDLIQNMAAIRAAASCHDITLVLIHAGNEFNPFPRPEIVKTYRSFIDAGASAVIGTHPHCPQGIEIHGGRPVVYSLGNFLFDGNNPIRCGLDSMWWKSHMVKLRFDSRTAVSMEVIPYDFGPDASMIKLLSGEKRAEYMKYLSAISEVIVHEEELMRYWDAWCDMHGLQWISAFLDGLKAALESNQETPPKKVYDAAHVFTCESHNDLVKNYLKMAWHTKLGQYKEYQDKIRKLQKGWI